MEAVARVRGAVAGVQAPAAESPRPLKRLETQTSPGSCDFKPTANIAGVPLMAANHTRDTEVGAPDNPFGSQPKSETGAKDDRSDDAVSGRESGRRRKRPSSDDIDRRERAAGAAERRCKIERRRGIGEDRAAMLERDSQASNPSRV